MGNPSKSSSFTVKMDKKVKNKLDKMCKNGSRKANKFIEIAVLREIERERLKESLAVKAHI